MRDGGEAGSNQQLKESLIKNSTEKRGTPKTGPFLNSAVLFILHMHIIAAETELPQSFL